MNYWTNLHEQKVKDYVNTPDQATRNKIYTLYLHQVITYMTIVILKRYFKGNILDKEDYIQTTVAKVYLSLDKFDQSKNAFSYIQTVIKNSLNDMFRKRNTTSKIDNNTFTTSDGEYNDIADGDNDDEYHFQHTEDVIETSIMYIKTKRTKNKYVKRLLECITEFDTVNRYFITYYILSNENTCINTLKSSFFRYEVMMFIYTFTSDNFFKNIFEKYGVNDEDLANWKYLLEIFDRYEKDDR